MNQLYLKKNNNDVKVCYDKLCVNAKGKNADLITSAVVVAIGCIAAAIIIRAFR